jgi:LuxR family maltose regulon positive regulatory protein
VTSVRSRAPKGSTYGAGSSEISDLDLRPPSLTEGLLDRTHLVDRLATADQASLIALVAPAGYGKTTLMAQWQGSESRPAAWLSLDPADNDPVALLGHLWASFSHAGMLVPDESGSPRVSSLPATDGIRRLVRALEPGAERGILFLDHIDSLRTRAPWDLIAALIYQLDGRVQVVLASRSEPRLPIAELRAKGLVAELNADDLAFDGAEAGRVIEHAGVVSDYDLEELMNVTEGWPVGIYLAALAMQDGSGAVPEHPVRGDDVYVAEYLRAAILDRLSDSKLSFLIRTSVLDRLSGPVCDAVLETTGSERVLRSLEQSNLLITRLDRTREWYRYHHMFQDLLQAELRLREPEAVVGLHSRAADWFEANGFPDLAIHHAQAAGDVRLVAQLLERIGRVTYSTGRSDTVFSWLDWLEEQDRLSDYPGALALGALAAALTGDVLRSARLFDLIGDQSLPLPRLVSALRTPSSAEAMIDEVRKAREDFPPGSEWTPACLAVEGLGWLWLGDEEKADSLFAHAITLTEPVFAVPTATITLAERALIAMRARDWDTAESACSDSLHLVMDHGLAGYSTSAITYVVAARIARHRNDLPRAREMLARAVRLRPQLNSSLPGISVQTGIEMAKAHIELAEVAGAKVIIRETRVILDQFPDLGLLPDQLEELSRSMETMEPGKVGPSTLTTAELRLLPLLASHHTFPEIGERLYISRHTVKTQAMSIYRKLGASSRSEAVRIAGEIGLLGV